MLKHCHAFLAQSDNIGQLAWKNTIDLTKRSGNAIIEHENICNHQFASQLAASLFGSRPACDPFSTGKNMKAKKTSESSQMPCAQVAPADNEPKSAKRLDALQASGIGKGRTLANVVRKGSIVAVKKLIKLGASPHDPEIVCIACEEGNVKALQILIDASVDLDVLDGEPLVLACRYGHSDVVAMLLEAGVSVTERARSIATNNGYRYILQLLLEGSGKA